MKKTLTTIITILAALFLPLSVWAQEYSYSEHNFTMTFPDSYYVIDEGNVFENANAAFIEFYGMSPADVAEIFRTSDKVTLAIRSDEQVTMHLFISQDDFSRQVWHLKTASDAQRTTFKDDINNSIEGEHSITNQEFIELGDEGFTFLRTEIEYAEGYFDIDFFTIHNGLYYDLKFNNFDISHTADTTAEITRIFESFRFTQTNRRPLQDSGIIWIIVGALIFVAAGAVYLIIIRVKKPNIASEKPNKKDNSSAI